MRFRFDFDAEQFFAIRSYASSAFFFVLTLPTGYYLLAAARLRRWLTWLFSGCIFVVLTLPWHWLGLKRFEVPLERWTHTLPDPVLKFFPRALSDPGFPHDRLFFSILFVAFALVAVLLGYRGRQGHTPSLRQAARNALPALSAYFFICLQTWMHTSMRSGYTLNAYFFAAPDKRNWYVTYLFPAGGGRGAVSSDLPWWWGLDYYFQGVPQLPPTMLLRRTFIHYLGSQLGYLVHPYLVYLALNTLLWFAAVAAFYRFVLRVSKRSDLATYAAALLCIGNGFIYFVGQPFAYLGGYCCAVFIPWAYVEFLAPQDSRSRRRTVVVGLGFALCALTYDVVPIFLATVGLAFVLRAGRLRVFVPIVLATMLYGAFLYLQYGIFELEDDPANSKALVTAKDGIIELLRHPQKGKLYELTIQFTPKLVRALSYAFELLVPGLAILGLWRARQPKLTRITLLLLAPAVLGGVFFHYGQASFSFKNSQWGDIPMLDLARLSYIAYPAVYLAAALWLVRVQQWSTTTLLGSYAHACTWCCVILVALWQNADAFGFISPAFHFYHPVQGPWLDSR